MIGKLIIPGFEIEPYDHIFEGDMLYDNSSDDDDDDDEIEEPEFLKKYDAGRDFVENYLTDDLNTMGNRWFGLPTYEELHDKFVNVVETKPRKKFALSSLIKTIKDKIKAGFDI